MAGNGRGMLGGGPGPSGRPNIHPAAIYLGHSSSLDSGDEHIRKRPSMMSDFKHAHAYPMPDFLRRDAVGRMQLDAMNRHGPAYSPQVENISPTPEEDPGPSRAQIADKLEKVEREIRGTQVNVKRLEKREQELEECSTRNEGERDFVEEEVSRHMTPFERIIAENRKKAQQSHASTLLKPNVPLYRQPSDIPALKQLNSDFINFKPKLIQIIKQEREAKEKNDQLIREKYDAQHAIWSKKIDRWENNPKKVARDEKNREFFEKIFPELKKQREEREKNTRVETRTSVLGTTTTSTRTRLDDGEEECKMRTQAVIPPPMMNVKEKQRTTFLNYNGLVADPWIQHTQRLDYFAIFWTDEEKSIFRDNIIVYGKNFAALAVFLPKKTTQDCVQYYYLTKKRVNYKQIMRKGRKRGPGRPYKPPAIPKKGDINDINNIEDTAPARVEPELFCLACKSKIEPVSNPGRVLTRSSYEQYGLDPGEKGAQDFRICLKCHCTGLRKKYVSCLIKTCSTTRRKAKLSRPVHPPKWKQLTEPQKQIIIDSIGIGEDVTKCCHACFKKINRMIDRVLKGELEEELSPAQWHADEMQVLEAAVEQLGTNSWDQVALRLTARSANECRMRYATLSLVNASNKVVTSEVAAGIESEQEDNSDDDVLMIQPEPPVEPPKPVVPDTQPAPQPQEISIVNIEEKVCLHKQVVTVLRSQDSQSNESNATLSADEADEQTQEQEVQLAMPPTPSNTPVPVDRDTNVLPSAIYSQNTEPAQTLALPFKRPLIAVAEYEPVKIEEVKRETKIESPEVEMIEEKPAPPPAVPSSQPAPSGSLTQGTPVRSENQPSLQAMMQMEALRSASRLPQEQRQSPSEQQQLLAAATLQMQMQHAQQHMQQIAARQQLALAHQYLQQQQQAAQARQWNMLDPQAQALMLLHQQNKQQQQQSSSTQESATTSQQLLMQHQQQLLEQEQQRRIAAAAQAEQHQRQLIAQTQQRLAEEQQRSLALARAHEHSHRAEMLHQQLQQSRLIEAAVAEHTQKSLAKFAASQRPTISTPSVIQQTAHNRVKSEPQPVQPAFISKGAMKRFPPTKASNPEPIARPSSIAATASGRNSCQPHLQTVKHPWLEDLILKNLEPQQPVHVKIEHPSATPSPSSSKKQVVQPPETATVLQHIEHSISKEFNKTPQSSRSSPAVTLTPSIFTNPVLMHHKTSKPATSPLIHRPIPTPPPRTQPMNLTESNSQTTRNSALNLNEATFIRDNNHMRPVMNLSEPMLVRDNHSHPMNLTEPTFSKDNHMRPVMNLSEPTLVRNNHSRPVLNLSEPALLRDNHSRPVMNLSEPTLARDNHVRPLLNVSEPTFVKESQVRPVMNLTTNAGMHAMSPSAPHFVEHPALIAKPRTVVPIVNVTQPTAVHVSYAPVTIQQPLSSPISPEPPTQLKPEPSIHLNPNPNPALVHNVTVAAPPLTPTPCIIPMTPTTVAISPPPTAAVTLAPCSIAPHPPVKPYQCDYEEISSDEDERRPSAEASVSPALSGVKMLQTNSPFAVYSLFNVPPEALSHSSTAQDPELTLAVQSITDSESATAVNNLPTYEPLSDDDV